MMDKASGWVLCLIGILLLTGCRSSGSSSAPADATSDSTRAERILAQVAQTPDSLATLPRPLFYESGAPTRGRSLSQFPARFSSVVVMAARGRRPPPGSPPSERPESTPSSSAHIEVEAVGGTVNGQAQWGLRIQSTVPDTLDLKAVPFVDLFGKRLLLRREQAWRRLSSRQDSLRETRFVPLSMKDVQRLSRADTVRLSVNGEYVRMPTSFNGELQKLVAATPDSLVSNAGQTEKRFTVYHNPDRPPEPEGGSDALIRAVDYPLAAKRKGLSGKVRIGFLVKRDGSTSHILVERGRHAPLIAEAVRTVEQLTFEPGTQRGTPVPTWRTLPFLFQIR